MGLHSTSVWSSSSRKEAIGLPRDSPARRASAKLSLTNLFAVLRAPRPSIGTRRKVETLPMLVCSMLVYSWSRLRRSTP